MASSRVTRNDWKQVAESVRAECDALTEMYAGLIEGSAAVAAPYRYGILMASISVEDAVGGAAQARRRIRVGAYYGIYQHEGTSRIAPNPFLRDAANFWRDDYLAAIRLVVPGA